MQISISKKRQIIPLSLCSCQAPRSNFMFKLLFNPMRLHPSPSTPVVSRGCLGTISLAPRLPGKCESQRSGDKPRCLRPRKTGEEYQPAGCLDLGNPSLCTQRCGIFWAISCLLACTKSGCHYSCSLDPGSETPVPRVVAARCWMEQDSGGF